MFGASDYLVAEIDAALSDQADDWALEIEASLDAGWPAPFIACAGAGCSSQISTISDGNTCYLSTEDCLPMGWTTCTDPGFTALDGCSTTP